MKIYKITEASGYLGVSINTLKTLANNGKIKSFKTSGGHRRFRQDDLDAYMGVDARILETEKKEVLARCMDFESGKQVEPFPCLISPVKAETAKQLFLFRMDELKIKENI